MTRKHKSTDEQAQQAKKPGKAPAGAESDELEALRRENQDLLARLQRVSADYLNYQKRTHRDAEQTREFANEQLIRELLGVLDDMERALGAARQDHAEGSPLYTGMQLVHDKAIQTLESFGLKAIDAVSKPFDPDLHSAMMQEESNEHPPNTVLRELLKGYQLKGRTIRPSGVVVSRKPEPVKEREQAQLAEQDDRQEQDKQESASDE